MSEQLIIKTADIADLEKLVEYRVRFALEFKPSKDEDEIRKIYADTKEYFIDKFAKKSYIGFLGYVEDEIVCTAGLLLYELPPLIGNRDRFVGHVLNFYTVEKFRKNGYGTELMEYIKLTAKQKGIKQLFLNATKMGEGLYRKAGFKEKDEAALVFNFWKDIYHKVRKGRKEKHFF